jgi:hypothetical protein
MTEAAVVPDRAAVWGALTRATVDGRAIRVVDLFVGADAEDAARTFSFARFEALRASGRGVVSALEITCGPVDLSKLRAGTPLVPDSRMVLTLSL